MTDEASPNAPEYPVAPNEIWLIAREGRCLHMSLERDSGIKYVRSDLAAVVPDVSLIEGARGDDYPSMLAMKYAVEMEIVNALERVQTQTLGKIIQRAINDALASAPKPPANAEGEVERLRDSALEFYAEQSQQIQRAIGRRRALRK